MCERNKSHTHIHKFQNKTKKSEMKKRKQNTKKTKQKIKEKKMVSSNFITQKNVSKTSKQQKNSKK